MRAIVTLCMLSLLSACTDIPTPTVSALARTDTIVPSSLSPIAECEFAATHPQIANPPPYCSSANLRGVIPVTPAEIAQLASMTLVSIQLAFGDTQYSRLDNREQFPAISLSLNQYLSDISNYTQMRSPQSNGLTYIDTKNQQQWLAQELAPCLLGGSISARVKDSGQVGTVDTGDQWTLDESNCLTASFSKPPGTPSLQYYQVTSVTADAIKLSVTGHLRRDLQGLAITASAPLGLLVFSAVNGGRVRYDGNQAAYCIGAAGTLEDSIDSLCSRLAVVIKNIHATRAHLNSGLYLEGIAYFTIAFDRNLNSRRGIAASEFQVTSFELQTMPMSTLPEAGVLTIMGQLDERLILTFHKNGETNILRMNTLGEQQKQTVRTAYLLQNTRWHEAVSPPLPSLPDKPPTPARQDSSSTASAPRNSAVDQTTKNGTKN